MCKLFEVNIYILELKRERSNNKVKETRFQTRRIAELGEKLKTVTEAQGMKTQENKYYCKLSYCYQ